MLFGVGNMQFVEGWALELLPVSQVFRPRPVGIGGDHNVSDAAGRFAVLGCRWLHTVTPKQECDSA